MTNSHRSSAPGAGTAHARWLMALQTADASAETDWVACRTRVESIDAACRRATTSTLDLREVPETARQTLLRVSPDGWRALDEHHRASRGSGITSVLLPSFANDPDSRRAAALAGVMAVIPGMVNVGIPCGPASSNGVSKTDLLALTPLAKRAQPLTVALTLPAWAFTVKVTVAEGLRVVAEPAAGRPFKASVTFRRNESGHVKDRIAPLTFADGGPVAGSLGSVPPRTPASTIGELPSLPTLPNGSSGAFESAHAIARQDARAAIRRLADGVGLRPGATVGEQAIRKLILVAGKLDGSRTDESTAPLDYPIRLADLMDPRDWRRLKGPAASALEDALNRLVLIRDLEARERSGTCESGAELSAIVGRMARLAQALPGELPQPLPDGTLTRWSSRFLRSLRLSDHPLDLVTRRLQDAGQGGGMAQEHLRLLQRCLIGRDEREILRSRHRVLGQHKRLALELYFELCDEIRRRLEGSPCAAPEEPGRKQIGEPAAEASARNSADELRRKGYLLARKERAFSILEGMTAIDPPHERRLHWLVDRLAGTFDILDRSRGPDFEAAELACRETMGALEELVALIRTAHRAEAAGRARVRSRQP